MYTNNHLVSPAQTPKKNFKATLVRFFGNPALRWIRRHSLAFLIVPSVATVSFLALSGSSAPNIPAVVLSADPLYATTAGDKPALALALSVEFPTVGAQYVDPDNNSSSSDDDTYSSNREYLGYYDAESCYTYDDTGSGAPTGQTAAYKRFIRRGPAIALTPPDAIQPTKTTRMCWDNSKSYTKDDGTTPATSAATNDAFSGNFLNWATNSAIDMLRLSLTGGDRTIDTATLTVLQRAFIPDGNPISMWNSPNFPAKRLYRSGTSLAITSSTSPSFVSGVPYFGAIPKAMADTAASATKDIWVANTLNKIYFGTDKVGNNSGSASSYTLGASAGSGIGTVTKPYQTASTGLTVFQSAGTWTACPTNSSNSLSGEGVICSFTGVKEVLFGGPSGSQPDTSKPGGWLTYVVSDGVTCGNTMTGQTNDPASGIYKKCYYRNYTASTTGTTAQNSDSFFYARVQVCDRDPTTYVLKDVRDYGLCKKYSDGGSPPQANYKPTGVVQKYSDQLRLAAFGYLLDQTASYNSGGRYGGVLRAPMKFVGGKTFDINGIDNTPSGGNPKQEWDQVTGVFNLNSEGNSTVPCTAGTDCSASYLSGVITYVNQFGRTGSVQGRYKRYDPVGELHYEALRYLQGLAPSAAAVSSLNTDMYDGFPVATTWPDDPYGNGRSSTADYSCLKSNIVVIGDINTHDGNRLPTANANNNIPDINAWRTVLQNFEKNITSSSYIDGQGITRSTGNPNGANYAVPGATQTSQILGSAYWARTHDIRGAGWTNATTGGTAGTDLQRRGLRVKTFTFDVNENGGSNNANTRRTSNQLFMAAKYGGFETDPSNPSKSPYNTKGNPFYRDDMTTADKYVWSDTDTRTSRVGEANTYFLQSDARGVLSAFDDIFSRASTAARSIAGVAIQSKNLTQLGNTIYQGTFDTADWSGDLDATTLTVSTANAVVISTKTWSAATQLGALTSPAISRNIVMGNLGLAPNPVAAPFSWGMPAGIAGIEVSLRAALDKEIPAATSDGLAQDRLNYLRGDRSKEGAPFRIRKKLLGDIINSGVVYSGAPTTSISSSTYASFYSTNAARTPAVFVGANDGMLHAFNATNGNELFGYIPSWMGPKLSALTSTNYTIAHQSYVDGTPTVAEAQVGSAGTASDWKTVLVGGTGGGGRGVFALDVTNPSTFSASNVMWEFTQADDLDMGNVTGRPQILKFRTSAYNATSSTYKWFAVVGSGLNNYATDSTGLFSSTANPALFLLDLSKPAGTAWSLGTNYYKVSLPVDSTISLTTGTYAGRATGLINFRAALGAAREVTQIYMGDLHGNLWKLDFSLSLGTTEWNINKLSSFNKGTSSSPSPYPLFIAKDASGNVQPITMAPSIAFGPKPNTSYLFFGTGKYYEASDKGSTAQQTEYMVFDNDSNSGDSSPIGASAISGRQRLKQGTINTTTGVISTPAFTPGRAITDVNTEIIRSGWYADLPTAGERQISSATIFGTKVVFGTLIPGSTGSSSCTAAGGGGNQFTVDIATGNGDSYSSGVGLLGEPLVAEISSATAYTSTDSTGRRTKTITSQIFQQGSAGLSAGRTSTVNLVVGRLSWRQINNYQDLKNAP